jgi:hypothetical protein
MPTIIDGTAGITFPVTAGGTSAVQASSAKVLQVVSTTKTDTFAFASASLTDITGLSVTITPTNTSNKILVICHVGTGGNFWNTGGTGLNLVRGSTNILTASSNGYSVFFNAWSSSLGNTLYTGTTIPIVYLDSPATTSATTYKLQVANASATDTGYINRTNADSINSRMTSTITVMEISG